MMFSSLSNGNFATNGEYPHHNENEDMGLLARSVQYDNIENRMTAMMMKATSSTPFGETSMAKRKEATMKRNERLQALVTEGVLRPSDVFLKSGQNAFLAKLVPGTFSYYQRVRENSFLFQEYHSCYNDIEQQRILQEIVESVWLNEGRFLMIDKDTNSVVVVDDQKLPGMIFHDLLSRENAFPALWRNGSFAANKIAKNNNNNNKRKVTVAKMKNHTPLYKKALNGSRNDNKFFTPSQKRQNAATLSSNLAENVHIQNDNNKGSVVGQQGVSATGSRPSRGGRAPSRRYTYYRNKKSGGDKLSY